ncbi:uncharacterized protein LOC129587592 [Paramacrobiotus metropolitanus]|uniref:uncharacterized protein LOC129587592 n=1 Tax=Paramacrobiotus metropolitanus TaxID=2943436 RepID=UPI00244580F4|nr:uncharacterized protein LOC129587592 [Paramacrobiotus metropolitanus]
MRLTRSILRGYCLGWTLLLAVHVPLTQWDYKRLRFVEDKGLVKTGFRKGEKLAKFKDKQRSAEVNHSSDNQLDNFLDYDLIEVFRTDAVASAEDGMGFLAVGGRHCPGECIRGLSGLCICPPATAATPPAKTPDSAGTARVANKTSSDVTTSGGESSPTATSPRSGRHNNQLVHLDAMTDSLSASSMTTSRNRRRYKRDDEDEEDHKLCKCRRCTKLFKRTLYCRVFPCYQKKCKSGEWREPHH